MDWTLRSGVRVVIRSYADWCSFNEVFANHEYTLPIRESIASAVGPLRVLDLGANFGYFTLNLADVHAQERKEELAVWMVEASPATCEELRRRIQLSRARMSGSVINGLAGKRSGTATLNYAREDNQNFVAESPQRDHWTRTRGTAELNYVDLAALVADAPGLDLVKCDIEGSEFDFIRSYPDLLGKTKRLVIEFHSAFGDIPDALDRLKTMGFSRSIVLREDAQTPVIYLSRV